MRQTLLPAALLLICGLTSACAHQTLESTTVSKLETASAPAEFVGPAGEPTVETAELAETEFETGATVISFDDVDGDMPDAIVAPPKREQIPSFDLFGTAESASTDGPELTLPPGVE